MPDPTPVPPRMTSRFFNASNVRIPVVCQTRITSFSAPVDPSHSNFPASNRTPCPPSAWCTGMALCRVAMVVPSFGAIVYMKLAASTLPPPGMFCTSMLGLPGMNRGMWRAISRAVTS